MGLASKKVEIYDSINIDNLPWPENSEGQYAKKYLYPFVKNGASHYIDNVSTSLKVLLIDDIVLPFTVNHAEYENSHVCSPYTHYIGSAYSKIGELENRFLKKGIFSILAALKWICSKGKINKVVIVNNWLFSTNLYVSINDEQVKALTDALTKLYPQHTILFPSLNSYKSNSLQKHLKKNNYSTIPSRQVYFLNTQTPESQTSRMYKSDLKVMQATDYEVIRNHQITLQDIPRIQNLYRALYLEKYSEKSPQYNHNFFEHVITNNLLSFIALKKNNQVDGVMGYYSRNDEITSPLFGYDTQMPQSLGLYRIISTLLTLEAKQKKMLLNQSSGASSYKKLRRAEEVVEYLAVYNSHLPFGRRLPWILLNLAMNKIGLPLMKRYNL